MAIFTPDAERRAMGGQDGESSEEAGAGEAGVSERPGGPRGRGWTPGDLHRDLRGVLAHDVNIVIGVLHSNTAISESCHVKKSVITIIKYQVHI